jgi:hypothetical protein
MAKKICIICGKRNATSANGVSMNDMCDPCYVETGHENEHSDNGHDDILAWDAANDGTPEPDWFDNERPMTETCWICHPELNKAKADAKVGHTNTVAKSYHSHATCKHPVTPKARAACRKAGGPKA